MDKLRDPLRAESSSCVADAHPAQLCRLCATTVNDVVYIFSSTGYDLNLPEKINRNLPVKVRITDPLPKQLCMECVNKVNICEEFAEMCLEAEGKLITLMKLMHFRSHSRKKKCGPMNNGNLTKISNKNFICSETSNVAETVKLEEISSDESCGSPTRLSSPKGNPDHESVQHEVKAEKVDFNVQENENQAENLPTDSGASQNFGSVEVSYCCPLCREGSINVQNMEVSMRVESTSVFEVEEETNVVDNINDISNTACDPLSNYEHSLLKNDDSNIADENYSYWWNVENALVEADVIIDTLNPQSCDEYQDLESNDNNQENIEKNCDNSNIMESEISYSCIICNINFTCVDSCLDHAKEHSENNKYPCSLCSTILKTEFELRSHFKDHQIKVVKSKHRGKRLVCSKCNRRFNGEKTYRQHSCSNTKTKKFQCKRCEKSFTSKQRLVFHTKFHEGAKPYFCEKCQTEFHNEGTLYCHTCLAHSGESSSAQSNCYKELPSNSKLGPILNVHSAEKPFACEFCGRSFYDREILKGHYVTHMSIKPYQCDYCGMCCGRLSMLKQHIQSHHSDSSTSKRLPSLIHYHCKTCKKTFTNSSDVLNHRSAHWGTKSSSETVKEHVCEYCGKSFSVLRDLGRHRKREHPDEKPYICSLCKQTSHTLYEARVHRKVHIDNELKIKARSSEENPFVCEACGKLFDDKRSFTKHSKEHKPQFSCSCKVCGKDFADNQRLNVHMRLHTGEKPYACGVCSKRFSQTSALYTHALLHTGEKPHPCDLCGKSFRIKADRDNHRRTHTGEKPYKCEFCGKQFRTGQVYYQHRMIHTGERRFPCDMCGKAFKRSHTLVVHKRIHTGEKPNICDICGKAFRQRSDMRKHRSIHGPNQRS